jgi:hypothetical protein
VRGNCQVVHYHQVRQERVLSQQACPKPAIIKDPNKIQIQFFDQKSQKWQLVPEEKLGAFYQNKEKIKERETMSNTAVVTQPIEIATTTSVNKSSKTVREDSVSGSFNSADSASKSSSRDQSIKDSFNSSSVNNDSRYQGRNSHNNVTINDDHSVVNDNSTNIKIGRYVDRSQRGKNQVMAGRDSSDNDRSSVKDRRSDDHSTKSWKMKKAQSSSEANGNSSEVSENKSTRKKKKKEVYQD